MSCPHVHTPSSKNQKKAYTLAIVIAFIFMLVEVIGGWIASSLALISDALHLFTDLGALSLGLIVVRITHLQATPRMSYGYHRAEVLGALASSVSLWVLSLILICEAIRRLIHPEEVQGMIVFIIATIGLFANIAMLRILHPIQGDNLSTKAAYLHVISDLLGSVGVILSGVLIWIFHWNPLDAIITILFTFSILYNSGKIILNSISVLMESTPPGIHPETITEDLLKISGVKEVHDLHIWCVTPDRMALSVHLVTTTPAPQKVLDAAHRVILKEHKIHHMTIQIEDPEHFEPTYCYDSSTGPPGN